MERHPVPQNIMDVEFKLFGALTIKQFAYLAGGFVVALLIYFADLPSVLKLIFISLSVILGMFLSLAKINGQPSSTWLSNYILALVTSQERVWRKSAVTPEILREDPTLKTLTQKRMNKVTEVTDARKLPQVPFAAFAKEEQEVQADQEEKQRLTQIDQHFDFLANQLPKYGGKIPPLGKMPTGKQPFVPEKATMKPGQSPVVNMKNHNLAGAYEEQTEKGIPVVRTPTYSAIVRPMPKSVDANRPVKIIDQVMDEMDNSAGASSEPVAENQTIEETPTKETITEKVESEVTDETEVTTTSQFNKANIIYGVVQAKEGKPLTKAEISIKDQKGEFIRKAFTGTNGYFSLTTPLANGVYYIDIVAEKYKFPRYTLNLNGKVLPGYKFVSA